MARRPLYIGSAVVRNAGAIGFIGRPIDETARSQGSFESSASRTRALIAKRHNHSERGLTQNSSRLGEMRGSL